MCTFACRVCRVVRIGVMCVPWLSGGNAFGQNFVVSNLADSGAGSLRQAMLDANAYNASSSSTSITFQPGLSGTINLAGMLPFVSQARGVSIDGAGASIVIDGGSSSNSTGDRVFFVGVSSDIANANLPVTTSTNFAISNLVIQNGNARGGNGGNSGGGGAGLGGGIFLNAGNLALSNVMFNGNRAVGGLGGTTDVAGGGGGMGGNGGTYYSGGGGGFGLGADGGGAPSGPGAYAAGSAGKMTGANPGGRGGFFNGAPAGLGGINGGGGGGSGSIGGGGGGGVGGTNGSAGTLSATGGPGGFGGGGGGAVGATGTHGGNGGFGGGGGGGFNSFPVGATGGFGGGGGSGNGAPGFGATAGTATAGGNGLGAGGAIFVRDGSSLSIDAGSFAANSVTGGNPTNPSMGQAIFLGSNVTISVNTGAMTIADTLGGDGGLGALNLGGNADGGITKTGAGTLILSGANNYSGGTAINGGTLLVNNVSGSGTGRANIAGTGGAVTVNNTAILGGTGSIAGSVTVNSGGTVAPGASPGILTINNNIVFQSGSFFSVELNGTAAGTQYDQLAVNGTVNLSSSLLVLNVGYAANPGDSFFVLVNDGTESITGTFTGLPQDGTMLIGNQLFGISYQGDYSTGERTNGNDVVLFAMAVPEPSTLALCAVVGVVAAGTGYWHRRRGHRGG